MSCTDCSKALSFRGKITERTEDGIRKDAKQSNFAYTAGKAAPVSRNEKCVKEKMFSGSGVKAKLSVDVQDTSVRKRTSESDFTRSLSAEGLPKQSSCARDFGRSLSQPDAHSPLGSAYSGAEDDLYKSLRLRDWSTNDSLDSARIPMPQEGKTHEKRIITHSKVSLPPSLPPSLITLHHTRGSGQTNPSMMKETKNRKPPRLSRLGKYLTATT